MVMLVGKDCSSGNDGSSTASGKDGSSKDGSSGSSRVYIMMVASSGNDGSHGSIVVVMVI